MIPAFLSRIVITVKDLTIASQAYSLLFGRRPSWQGTRPDSGTASVLFRLDNICLELISLAQDKVSSPLADRISCHLQAHGEGLLGMVFGTSDLPALMARMRQQGADVSDALLEHAIDPDSQVCRSQNIATWEASVSRGIFSFAAGHNEDEAIPLAKVVADGPITAVDHIVVQTTDAAAAKRFYRDQLGIRLALEQSRAQWGGDMLFFRTNHMSIEVIASERHIKEQDRLWGLALKTDSIKTTQERLLKAGLAVSEVKDGRKVGTLVCTLRSGTLSIPTLLIQHP